MRQPRSMWSLETFGRQRLSKHFYMRDFMYSEINGFHGVPNVPTQPDLVLENGRQFCTQLLDPLEETFWANCASLRLSLTRTECLRKQA